MDLIRRYKAGDKFFYEFDLKSCFNKISLHETLDILKKDYNFNDSFINFLQSLLTTSPIHKNLEDSDQELKTITQMNIPHKVKYGLPQG